MDETYRVMIDSALRLVGVLGQGESASGEQATEALRILRGLIDSWNGSDLLLYKTAGIEVDLVPGQASYTIGPNGDIDVYERPTQIQAAFITSMDGYDREIVQITSNEWGRISDKNTSEKPSAILYSYGFPRGTATLYPVPDKAYKLKLHYLQPLDSDIGLDAVTQLPPGYYEALRYKLAIRLYAEYGQEPSPSVLEIAKEHINRIKQNNTVSEPLRYPFGRSGYSIFTDGCE